MRIEVSTMYFDHDRWKCLPQLLLELFVRLVLFSTREGAPEFE